MSSERIEIYMYAGKNSRSVRKSKFHFQFPEIHDIVTLLLSCQNGSTFLILCGSLILLFYHHQCLNAPRSFGKPVQFVNVRVSGMGKILRFNFGSVRYI